MLHYLTPLDYILWTLITLIQIELFRISKNRFKAFRLTMLYLLAQSFSQLLIMIFSHSYRDTYYIMTIAESLFLSATSIEFGKLLVPKYKKLLTYLGPIAIAVPTFITSVIVSPIEISKESFITKSIRISELSFIWSLAILFICMAFEDDNSKHKEVARGYAAFLTLLVICTEVQLRTGITDFVRIIWPLSWLIGLSLVYGTIHRCRHTWKLSNSIEEIQNGYTC